MMPPSQRDMKKSDTEQPDPEVIERPKRRTFTLEYKWSILEQVKACTKPGEIGALLRREGLYSSHLTKWRVYFENAGKNALEPVKRGRKPKAKQDDAQLKEVRRLQKENALLQTRLKHAELIIDVQKKVSALLGSPLLTNLNGEDT